VFTAVAVIVGAAPRRAVPGIGVRTSATAARRTPPAATPARPVATAAVVAPMLPDWRE
jgi:hypothetical protein